MADTNRLDEAFQRFEQALAGFEAAVARRQEAEKRAADLANEADALRRDRSKLAHELDLVRTKAGELATTGKQAAGKIDAAMSRIRAVLHSNSEECGMGHVIVEVNGRPYTMQCPDGEEEHLRELARLLDSEVMRIKQSVGTVGDIRLLVMSGLMVADRLSEAIGRIEVLEQEIAKLEGERSARAAELYGLEQRVADQLNSAASRLASAARDFG